MQTFRVSFLEAAASQWTRVRMIFLSHSNQTRAINSLTGQQKWSCWVWEEANLMRNTIFSYWVAERAKADVWGSSVRSSSKSGKFVKWIVMTLDFGSQFYLIFIVSQRPPKCKSWARDQIWNVFFPQTKIQHQSVLYVLFSSAKNFNTPVSQGSNSKLSSGFWNGEFLMWKRNPWIEWIGKSSNLRRNFFKCHFCERIILYYSSIMLLITAT